MAVIPSFFSNFSPTDHMNSIGGNDMEMTEFLDEKEVPIEENGRPFKSSCKVGSTIHKRASKLSVNLEYVSFNGLWHHSSRDSTTH